MTLKPIVLYGAGGMGRETAQVIDAINWAKPTFDFLGYVVDAPHFEPGQVVNGMPVLGDETWILERAGIVGCTCAIGAPRARRRVQERLEAGGVEMVSLVDPEVWIPPSTTVGAGSVVFCDCRISVNCTIGKGVFLNCGVTLGHDDVIGSYTCIMPGTGISGRCSVGEEASFGGHAFVVPGKRIGDGATVAAGSVVFSNVRPNTTVLGNPAKRMRALED